MADKTLPLLCRALTILRSALGWDQNELARAVGVRPAVISDLERGQRSLTRERVEELARAMGLPPEAVEWALSFVQSLDAVAQAPGYSGSAELERQQVEALAAETGRLTTDFFRSLLSRTTAHGRALVARQQAAALWGIMKRRKASDRRMLVEDAQEFRSWALCELVCAESVKAAADDAGRAVELAELAVLIADLAPGEETWRWRLQGYAGIHLGNARRVQGNLPRAEEAFNPALKLWEAGAPGDPGLLSEAQVLSLEASLRTSQDRLPEAMALLDRALAANPGAVLRSNLLIQKARVLEWAGDYEGALATLRRVGPLPPEREEPRQLCMLRYNAAWNLTHLGRYAEAAELLPEIRALTVQLDNKLDTLRLRWLEGRAAAGLGRLAEAIEALSQVRAEFADRGIAYDTALATLELAVVHLEQGRTREVKLLARQMAPIFKAQGVPRGALAALKLFCEAAEKETATVELARRVVEFLYRAQHQPELQFEAGG